LRPMPAALAAALVVLSIAAGAARPARAEPEDARLLAYKWTRGDVQRYRLTQDQRQRTEGLPGALPQSSHQEIELRQEIADVSPEGVAEVRSTYETVRLKVEQAGRVMVDYDSTRPADITKTALPMVKTVAGLVGQTVSYKVARDGSVSDVKGFDEIMDKALADLAENPRAQPMVKAMKKSFGNESMGRQLETSLRVVPAKEVAPGAKWETTARQPVPMLGVLVARNSYELEGFAPEGARIGFTGAFTVTASAEPEASPFPGVRFALTMTDSKSKGAIIFDHERGRVLSSAVEVAMEMDIEIGGPQAGAPKGGERTPTMKGHQATDQRVVLELLKTDQGESK
jgi:hypothetical protein